MQDGKKTKGQLIDELKALRQALVNCQDADPDEESVRRYQSVVDTIVDGIITIDERGTIQSFNPAAEQIFGYATQEVIGQNISLLMPEPYRMEHDGYIKNYLETGRRKIIGIGREVSGRRKNGSTFPLDLAVSEFHLGGQRMFTGIVRDITERKQLEAQLAQAQKMESVGQLAGGIAHDFNNQLGIVLFDLDMLLAERQQDARLREDLLKMRRVVLRAANLTRQLLFFSRRQPLEPRPLDLNHQVRELQKMVGRLLGAAIRVETDLAEDLWIATADPASIDQVILNLALNSRDAMPQGGVLKFTTDNLELDDQHSRHPSQARPGRFVCLKVQDTGTGMEEHVRQRVFEPFFTTKEPGKGTGLGLSVVYGIIEAHRGWIEVESAPGKGSTFSFYLPAPDKEVEEREPSAPEGTAARQRGRGERILLLEDEPDLCERTRRVLTDHGYAVQSCHTVAQARELFRQADGRFDLAICDATVPDGRGTQLAFHLRGGRPGLAVLVITGYLDNHPDWERVRRERVPVLQKPFAVTELLDQVHAALHS